MSDGPVVTSEMIERGASGLARRRWDDRPHYAWCTAPSDHGGLCERPLPAPPLVGSTMDVALAEVVLRAALEPAPATAAPAVEAPPDPEVDVDPSDAEVEAAVRFALADARARGAAAVDAPLVVTAVCAAVEASLRGTSVEDAVKDACRHKRRDTHPPAAVVDPSPEEIEAAARALYEHQGNMPTAWPDVYHSTRQWCLTMARVALLAARAVQHQEAK